MLSHEIAKSDFDVIVWASKDVFRNQDSPDWSPYLLPEPLLTVWAVEQAQGVIDNGGLGYFYENDWPQNPPYSVFWDAFRRIGASEAAQCIETTAKLFPSECPELDFQMRRDYLNFSSDKAGSQPDEIDRLGWRIIDLGGSTFQLLARYIREHPDHFPTVTQNRTDSGV
jgi:hypothetical protein